MLTDMENISIYIQVFILVLIRVSAMMIIAPIFSRKQMPMMIKIGLSFMIAIIITPLIELNAIQNIDNLFSYTLIIIIEFVIGLMIGFIAFTIFSCLYIAGQLIDMQIGFGMVSVMDPNSNIQMPVMANFYSMVALIIFLMVDGHHMLISSLFYSYKILPIGQGVVFSDTLYSGIMKILADVFVLGFKVSIPVVGTIIVTDVVLGILSKSVPQINVFMVGMPVKIIIGIIVVILGMPLFNVIVENMLNMMHSDIEMIIRGMAK